MWHVVVEVFGLPGRCDIIRRNCVGGIVTFRRGPGSIEHFGLQLKAKKCTFMQTEVPFLGHIVGRAGLACDPGNVSAVSAWHAPGSVRQVRQFVGFIGYYRRFIQDFAGLLEPLVVLTRKGVTFAWTDEQQIAFDTLKACLLNALILDLPTEDGRFVLDTDVSLFVVGGVLNQLQDEGGRHHLR